MTADRHHFSDADRNFMRRAIDLAKQGDQRPGASPIGCVIVLNGKIIGEAYNLTEILHDPTAHAEILAMREAGARIENWEMRGAALYTTLQPCGMCTMAAIWAKIGSIIYGAGRDQVHSMYFEDRHLTTQDFLRDAHRDDLTIRGGLLSELCATLYLGPHDFVPVEEQVNV